MCQFTKEICLYIWHCWCHQYQQHLHCFMYHISGTVQVCFRTSMESVISPPFGRNKWSNTQPNPKATDRKIILLLHLIDLDYSVEKLTESKRAAALEVTACGVVQMRVNEGTAAWVTARNEAFSDVRCILCRLEPPCRPTYTAERERERRRQ